MNFRRTEARHPGVRWALGALEFTIVDALLVFGVTPAWAAFTLPISEHYTINFGELPQWIVALVAAGGFWKAWAAEAKVKTVSAQIDGLLADRDKAKVKEGEVKGAAAGAREAEALKEGQRQGAETERASVAAANPAPPPPGIVAGEALVAVADEKTGRAIEASAEALKRLADATTDIAKKT